MHVMLVIVVVQVMLVAVILVIVHAVTHVLVRVVIYGNTGNAGNIIIADIQRACRRYTTNLMKLQTVN